MNPNDPTDPTTDDTLDEKVRRGPLPFESGDKTEETKPEEKEEAIEEKKKSKTEESKTEDEGVTLPAGMPTPEILKEDKPMPPAVPDVEKGDLPPKAEVKAYESKASTDTTLPPFEMPPKEEVKEHESVVSSETTFATAVPDTEITETKVTEVKLETPKKKTNRAIIGAVIGLVVLVIGGLFAIGAQNYLQTGRFDIRPRAYLSETGCTYYSCTQKLIVYSDGSRTGPVSGFCSTNYPSSDPCGKAGIPTSTTTQAPTATVTTSTGAPGFNSGACTNWCTSNKSTSGGGQVGGRFLAGKNEGGISGCECYCKVGSWNSSFSTCQGTSGNECTSGQTGVRDGITYVCVNGNWIPGGEVSGVPTGTGACTIDNPSVTNSHIAIGSGCPTLTLQRYERDAPAGTTHGDCVGTSSNRSDSAAAPGQTYRPSGSCGKCVQIDVVGPDGRPYGTAAYTGACSGGTTTQAPTGQCTATKLYIKDIDGNWSVATPAQVAAGVKIGDQIRIATKGSGRVFTSGRFRVKVGDAAFGDWLPSTVKNEFGEYYVNYTIPSGGTFDIQAQVL